MTAIEQHSNVHQGSGRTMRRSHRERTEQSQERMLDAATHLILTLGTEQTTLKEIGEQAGYSRGLANARFGSKDALLQSLAERCRAFWIAELKNAAQDKTGKALLLSRIDAMVQFAAKHPDDAKVMYILWFESVGQQTKLNEGLKQFHRRARLDISRLALSADLFTGTNRQQEADDFAVRFCGLIFGLCYQWLVDETAIDIEETLKALRTKIDMGHL